MTQHRRCKILCALVVASLLCALQGAHAAVQTVAPIFLFESIDAHRFQTPVTSYDGAGCRQGETAYCQARGSVGFDPAQFEPYVFKFSVCYNRVSNFGGLNATCPSATPSYTFNGLTRLCERAAAAELRVTPAPVTIPTASRVLNKQVLTRADLSLYLHQGAVPLAGLPIALASDRGAADRLIGPAALTDADGRASAEVSTRDQSGIATVVAADATAIRTTEPGVIPWLPAKYESPFLVTCYTIAQETEHQPRPVVGGVCGLPPQENYRTGFLADVKMQGSGIALNGEIIHYRGSGCYNKDACARTASGSCAQVGTTIAVDPAVIPRKAGVNVTVLGQRHAQDGGGWIRNYHIDDYMGPASAQCRSLGRRTSTVLFSHY